jgi:hypothetical protein
MFTIVNEYCSLPNFFHLIGDAVGESFWRNSLN